MKPETFVPGTSDKLFQSPSGLKCPFSADGDRILPALSHTPASSRDHLLWARISPPQGPPAIGEDHPQEPGVAETAPSRGIISACEEVGNSGGYDSHRLSRAQCNTAPQTHLTPFIHPLTSTNCFSTDIPTCTYGRAFHTGVHFTHTPPPAQQT